jgi:hypothetical protein
MASIRLDAIGPPGTSDVERRAVVGARATYRQAQRDVDALVNAEILDRNQPLVVVHRNHHVEFPRFACACTRPHEDGIRWERTADIHTGPSRRFDRRRNDVDFFPPKEAALPGVRGFRPATPIRGAAL